MIDSIAPAKTGWKPLLLDLFGRPQIKFDGQQRTSSLGLSQSQRRHSEPPIESQPQPLSHALIHARSNSMEMDPLQEPSIPSVICPTTHSLPINFAEQEEKEVSSQSSIISEVTLITYSNEKAEAIKEEFFRRMQEQKQALNADERHALLRDVQQELTREFECLAKQNKKQDLQSGREHERDQSSIISEVTLMTYRIEKADMIKEEFLRRVNEHTKEMSADERVKLLGEIQQEQELKFKQRQADEHKMEKEEPQGGDLLKRFKMLKSHLMEKSLQSSSLVDNDVCLELERANVSQKYQKQMSRRGSLDTTTTPKHSNSVRNLIGHYVNDEHGTNNKQDQGCTSDINSTPPLSDSSGFDENHTPLYSPRDEEDTNIEKIIELKLLVANQQATIDDLSLKLHNFELAYRQLQDVGLSRMTVIEEENRDLKIQVSELRRQGPPASQRSKKRNSISAPYTEASTMSDSTNIIWKSG